MRSAGQISGLFTFYRELLGPSMIYRSTLGSYLRSTGQFWRVLYDLQVIFGGVSAFRRFILGPVHDLEVKFGSIYVLQVKFGVSIYDLQGKFGVTLRSVGQFRGVYLPSTGEFWESNYNLYLRAARGIWESICVQWVDFWICSRSVYQIRGVYLRSTGEFLGLTTGCVSIFGYRSTFCRSFFGSVHNLQVIFRGLFTLYRSKFWVYL